jgi:hypothetical protein
MKVGDKIEGFYFEEVTPFFVPDMADYNGKIGTIAEIDYDDRTIRVVFEDGEYWWYPIPDNQPNELLDMLKRAHEEFDCAEFRSHEGVSELLEEMEVLIKKFE